LQVDLNLPSRLGATYIGEDGSRHTPVLLHRAIFGSLERFIGVLLEHYAGALPLWLAPIQIVVATITSDADEYARAAVERFAASGLRAEFDLRNEKINYKVREHSLAKIPVIVAVGKREVAENTVSVRRFGEQAQAVVPLEQALEELRTEAAARGIVQ
jgi:threonyl-tRNA synthetase